MTDFGLDKRSKSARRAARTKSVRGFDSRIKELEQLITDVKAGEVSTTKANTIVRIYQCILDWTRGKRQVYLEEVLEAEIEELKREQSTNSS